MSTYAKGLGYVTTQDIILPLSMEIIDNTQHADNLRELNDLCIGLQIEKNRGYHIRPPQNVQDQTELSIQYIQLV